MLISATLLMLGAAAADDLPALTVIAQRADYPADALAAGIEGNVAIALEISPQGQLRCTIRDKKAPAALQRPSCQLVAGRWPFGPNMVGGVAQTTVTHLVVHWSKKESQMDDYGGATPLSPESWVMPEDFPVTGSNSIRGGTVEVTFDVKANGTIANCTVEQPARNRALTEAACPLLNTRAVFLPAIGPDGTPRQTKAYKTVRFTLG